MSDNKSSPQGRRRSQRNEPNVFRAPPGDLVPRDAQDLMAYPFFSSAKSKRTVSIDFPAPTIVLRVEAVPEHGMSTAGDADVLIWAASQIVHAHDAGLKTSRLMTATPYEILTLSAAAPRPQPANPGPARCCQPNGTRPCPMRARSGVDPCPTANPRQGGAAVPSATGPIFFVRRPAILCHATRKS